MNLMPLPSFKATVVEKVTNVKCLYKIRERLTLVNNNAKHWFPLLNTNLFQL